MTIRDWIAQKLCPQAFADQRSYEIMKAEAVDAYHWLGGFPDAKDALRWLLDNERNRRRAIGEPAIGLLPSSIDRFRDMLDRRTLSPPALQKRPAAFEVLDTESGVYLTRSEAAAQNSGFEYYGLYRRDSAEAAVIAKAEAN
jgi:hypothetical protein